MLTKKLYYLKKKCKTSSRLAFHVHCMFIACSLQIHWGVYEDVNPIVNSVMFILLRYPRRH